MLPFNLSSLLYTCHVGDIYSREESAGVNAMHMNAMLNMVNTFAAKHELVSTHCEPLLAC